MPQALKQASFKIDKSYHKLRQDKATVLLTYKYVSLLLRTPPSAMSKFFMSVFSKLKPKASQPVVGPTTLKFNMSDSLSYFHSTWILPIESCCSFWFEPVSSFSFPCPWTFKNNAAITDKTITRRLAILFTMSLNGVISSPDLVLAFRGQKKGEGEGKRGKAIWQNMTAWTRIWLTRQLRML